MSEANSEILIYQNQEGNIKIDVQLQDETVWLSQEQLATLFGKSKSTINEHIQNIYKEGVLEKEGTLQKFGIPEFQQLIDYKKAIIKVFKLFLGIEDPFFKK